MELSDSAGDWRQLPRWVDFLVQLGFNWPARHLTQRRVALISMPCDSAAAGFVAVGAFIRDLCDPTANDVDGHYDGLLRYAYQYLSSCRSCTVRCKPDIARCGYQSEASGKVRRLPGRNQKSQSKRHQFEISGRTNVVARQLTLSQPSQGNLLWFTTPEDGVRLQIVGDAPVEANFGANPLEQAPYSSLVRNARICTRNLQSSYSGLCLASRVGGASATRETCATIQFRSDDDTIHNLVDLLSVHSWSKRNTVSRVALFNTRTARFDRRAIEPSLVVVDGDAAFLEVVGAEMFQRSDVVGIFSRAIDRDRLEAVGARAQGLRQWYRHDTDWHASNVSTPPGLSVSVLVKD